MRIIYLLSFGRISREWRKSARSIHSVTLDIGIDWHMDRNESGVEKAVARAGVAVGTGAEVRIGHG